MLQWIAADLRTGRLLADLPAVTTSGPLRHSISGYDTASVSMDVTGAVEWERATLPGGAVLAVYDDDDNAYGYLGPIQWGGFVVQRTRDAGTSQVELSLATIEQYFDRRYVGDVAWAATLHRDDLIGWLFTKYVAEGTEPGLPLALAYTVGGGPAIGALTVWQNTDNATVLARLTEVCARWGGEFTARWSWSADQTSIFPVVYWGDRVGTAAA